MKLKNIILLVACCLFPYFATGQKKLDKALKTYESREFFEAIDELKDAYSQLSGLMDEEKKAEVIYKIADCYRQTNQSRKAEMWLRKAIKKGYPDPIIYLYYANALKMNEEYEEAVEQYKQYKELVPDDRRGDDGIKSCELSLVWKQNPSGYVIQEMKFFNSRSLDYAPCYARGEFDRVYFTSTRESAEGDEAHGGTGESFADIFESRRDVKGSWSEPVPLGEEINSIYEDGAPNLTVDFETMYFTRCEVSKKKAFGCQLYWSSRNGEDWAKAEEIEIKADSILIMQPAISPDELTLFFVSDMKGSLEESNGKASKDLWMIQRESKSSEWGEPVNLGAEINTPGSEVFPYVHPDGTLYFSSNGHVGMGGLDIFKAKQEGGKWRIENMRFPVNSPQDDFGITFEHEAERGFFSSSRSGRGDDIYSFFLPPLKFSITGIVKDAKTDKPLANASVKSISSDGITLESKTDEEGQFKYILKPSTDYVFVVSKNDFLNGKHRETTKMKTQSEDFEATIYLQSIKEEIKVDNIFYEYNKADLLPESFVALDKLVETLNDNPNVVIELRAHTDARGDHAYNDDLSQRRAQSVVDYLMDNGIDKERLVAKGYGKRNPAVVDAKTAEKYPFFFVGDELTQDFIEKLPNEDQKEIAYQLNRRTEFKVLRTNYVSR